MLRPSELRQIGLVRSVVSSHIGTSTRLSCLRLLDAAAAAGGVVCPAHAAKLPPPGRDGTVLMY